MGHDEGELGPELAAGDDLGVARDEGADHRELELGVALDDEDVGDGRCEPDLDKEETLG